MKCKVINTHKHRLEDEVNLWIENNNCEIKHVVQTSDSNYITLTIFYLDRKEIRKEKIDKINKVK